MCIKLTNVYNHFLILFLNSMQKAIVEARSNMKYLQILKQPCMKLYNIKNLNDIMNILPEIFFKIIFIFEESEYYNKK